MICGIAPSLRSRLRTCLIGAAFICFFAASVRAEPTDDEKRALAQAERSYKDGAFDLCSQRVAALLKKFPKTELAASAELLQAQALYQLGRSDAALAALTLPIDQVPDSEQTETLFWQAESLRDLSRWPEAEQAYRAVIARKDAGTRLNTANLGLAWVLFEQGKQVDANAIIQALIRDHGNESAGLEAQLLQAKILLAQGLNKEAITALQALLDRQPGKALTLQADYWLGEALAANGQANKAVALFEAVTGDAQAFPRTLVVQAWLALGRAQHDLNQNDQAMLAYEQTYHLTENETMRLDAFRSYLESARASGQLPEAVAKLKEFAKSSDPSAPAALFAIGTVLAENQQDDEAIGILETLPVAYATSTWVPATNEQLGELYARAGKPDQAVKALQSCIAASQDQQLIRTARFQLGYVLLKQMRDFPGAVAQFSQIAQGTDSAAENASYNLLLAEAAQGKIDAFTKAEVDFEKTFPASAYLKSIALAEGQLLTAAGRTDDAKATYQKAIALPGAGTDQAALLKALTDLQYQTGDLEGALATCKTIAAQFPAEALTYSQRGVLISYELKKLNEDQVETALAQLAQKYAGQPGAPEANFRLGEFYFYRQDYVRAQDAFQQITTNYPNSPNIDRAYFFAGRSAFAHQDYAAAHTLLEKVPDSSSFKSDARLWEGRTYQQQLQFSQAEALYDSVLATETTGPAFVSASLFRGECLFELGTKDPANYATALASFQEVFKSKEGTIADRNEAAVRGAKCLEKMNKTDDAMALYLDVLYGRLAGDDAGTPAPPEFSWQIKAGWEAGRIRESEKDWRGAIEIYKRLEQIGGAHAQDFHDLVNKLRRDNYIYE